MRTLKNIMENLQAEEAFKEWVESVLSIRCIKHFQVPQQNKNEHAGGECGGCIAEERDFYKVEMEAYKAVIDVALDRFQSLTGLTNAGLNNYADHFAEIIKKLELIEINDDGHVVWEHLRGVIDEIKVGRENPCPVCHSDPCCGEPACP